MPQVISKCLIFEPPELSFVMMPNTKICALPWIHLFVNNQGHPSPCCLTQSQFPKHAPLNNQVDADVFFNSNEMVSIRQTMLNGEEPIACKVCFDSERAGSWSYRRSMNERFCKSLAEIESASDAKPNLDPQFLDLRIGNICNLSCRMCSPFSSSKLSAEWSEFYARPINPLQNDETLFDIPSQWKNISLLSFAGGEPLISKKVSKTLTSLVESGKASSIDLRFNTNLTVLDSTIFSALSHFRSCDLSVSLDGFDVVNNYIRHPSKWTDIIDNLAQLETRFKDSNVRFKFNSTIQIYNIFSICELLNFLDERFGQKPSLNFLTDPKHYSIQSLPAPLKIIAEETLRSKQNDSNAEQTEAIIKFMNFADTSSHFPEFIRWTQFFDKQRGQSVKIVIPELSGCF